MKSRLSVVSSGYNIVWLAYTAHYVVLFSILSGEAFNNRSVYSPLNSLFPLNVVMNSVSVVLAVIGVLIAHEAAHKNNSYWTSLNTVIHALMVVWIFAGSLCVLFLLQ